MKKKLSGGPPSAVRGALVKLGHSLVHVQIWGLSTL